ncbi:MAG: hypothetical protein ABI702_22910 [Burkholderiales bacterium]
MNARRLSSRWALWAFAAALLLKAAMPWLASASAQMQGKALVEVCTVYGVSLVPLDGPAHETPAGDHTAHGNEHCTLTALTALVTPVPALLQVAAEPAQRRAASLAPPSPQAPDACATWVARLKHGPPSAA